MLTIQFTHLGRRPLRLTLSAETARQLEELLALASTGLVDQAASLTATHILNILQPLLDAECDSDTDRRVPNGASPAA